MKKIFTLIALAALVCQNPTMAQNKTGQTYATTSASKVYALDNCKLNSGNKYYEWFDTDESGADVAFWATANAGYNMVKSSAAADAYPTTPAEDTEKGKCVKLTTCNTGTLGAMFKSPIAAGNFFSGEFSLNTKNTLHSTKFGRVVTAKPVSLTCWYKYTPGATFKEYGSNGSYAAVEGKTDEGDIYAVLFKNTDADGNSVVLYGDDVKTNANIVATANMNDNKKAITATENWTELTATFDYGDSDIDYSVLKNGGYSLAIVCTSSKDGASFAGAEGSTMYVADMSLTSETVTGVTTTYTDNLVVKLSGQTVGDQKESLNVTENEDGTYTLELKNFTLGSGDGAIAVGTIIVDGVTPSVGEDGTLTLTTSKNITIADGDAGTEWIMKGTEVPVDVNATIKDNTLYAKIVINLLDGIEVEFGQASTGISNAIASDSDNTVTGIYDLSGRRVNAMQKGINIVRYADGKAVKVIRR